MKYCTVNSLIIYNKELKNLKNIIFSRLDNKSNIKIWIFKIKRSLSKKKNYLLWFRILLRNFVWNLENKEMDRKQKQKVEEK